MAPVIPQEMGAVDANTVYCQYVLMKLSGNSVIIRVNQARNDMYVALVQKENAIKSMNVPEWNGLIR